MAKRIERERRAAGGLEGTLDFAAIAILVIGIIGAVVTLVLLRFAGVLPAFGILINAALIWLLLRSVAEIIRLLKLQADLPFGGKISNADQTIVYTCSDCGALLHSETRCDYCGASIESD